MGALPPPFFCHVPHPVRSGSPRRPQRGRCRHLPPGRRARPSRLPDAERMKRLNALLAGAMLSFGALADGLPPTVLQALKAAQIPAANVAVVVQPVDAATPLVAHNAAQPMNPASVM